MAFETAHLLLILLNSRFRVFQAFCFRLFRCWIIYSRMNLYIIQWLTEFYSTLFMNQRSITALLFLVFFTYEYFTVLDLLSFISYNRNFIRLFVIICTCAVAFGAEHSFVVWPFLASTCFTLLVIECARGMECVQCAWAWYNVMNLPNRFLS